MGRARECEEYFEELVCDFGLDVTHETHLMYYQLIIASKRLAFWALTIPNIEPDLYLTATKVVDAKLGMNPDDEDLKALEGKVEATKELVRNSLGLGV